MGNVISFNVRQSVLVDDARLRPKPAAEVLPDWKTSIPAKAQKELESGQTARACPALHDYLHLGYVLPLWTDIAIQRISLDANGRAREDPDGDQLRWRTPSPAFPLEFHAYEQVEGAEPLEPPCNIQKVVKPLCPWLVEPPPGWSILVLPLILHEERRKLPLQPIPGIINTDHWHQIHTPCRWQNVQTRMMLRAGTPFMHIIPIPRHEALEPEFNVITDQARIDNLVGALTDFGGSYRRQQRVAEEKAAETETENKGG